MNRVPRSRPLRGTITIATFLAALPAAVLAAMLAVGCVVENPPPPPPPPPPPALPQGLVIQPSSLAEDAQANLWFTILGIDKAGRLDRGGSVSEFKLPPVSFGANIVCGPDGNLWMVGITAVGSAISGNIIKMTPDGRSTFYELPANWVPEGLAAGPDGNLWFTAWAGADPNGAVAIGQITTAGAITIFPMPESGTGPTAITGGPEHSVWFTEAAVGRIGRVAPDGKVVEYHLPKGTLPAQITAGPDGNVWFTENFSNHVARLTPTGQATEFTLPVSGKYEAIVSGPDRNLWIAVNRPGATPDSAVGAILRVTPSGACTVFPIPGGASISGLIARRDGTLVFSERWVSGGPTRIGHITTAGQITETSLRLTH
jgi:streptogramin lyase